MLEVSGLRVASGAMIRVDGLDLSLPESGSIHHAARRRGGVAACGERAGGGWIGVMGEAAPEAAARFSQLSPPGRPTRPRV